jgi:hypothetical protein
LKKFLSILIVFLIFFNAGGYFFIYYQLESYFKMEASAEINNYFPLDKLEQIIFISKSKSDINGIKFERINDNEVLYFGKMYDIYKEEKRNDTAILYCISDEKEDIIEKAFAEYLNEKNEDKSVSAVANIIKILITLGIQPENAEYTYYRTHNDLLNLYAVSFGKICIDIPSPPPRIIS